VALTGSGGKTTVLTGLARGQIALGRSCLITTTTRIMAPGPDETLWLFEDYAGFAARLGGQRKGAVVAARERGEDGKLCGLDVDLLERMAASGAFDLLLVEADGSRGRPLKGYRSGEPVVPPCASETIIVVGLGALGLPFDDESVHRADVLAERIGHRRGAPITSDTLLAAVVHPAGYLAGTHGARLLVLNQADTEEQGGQARLIASRLEGMNPGLAHVFIRGRLTGGRLERLW